MNYGAGETSKLSGVHPNFELIVKNIMLLWSPVKLFPAIIYQSPRPSHFSSIFTPPKI